MPTTKVTVVGPRVPMKRKRVTCLYNVQQYSDIIVTFSNRRIFAHKAILASSSLYFHRAFSSGFAVASSPEIDLGDDDDPNQVEVMLRVMYDDDTVFGLNVLDLKNPNFTKTYLDYYILGDKYDFPILRHQAKQMFLQDIGTCVNLRSENSFWNSESFDNSATGIARVLGPSATTFADRSIQEETLEWCAMHFDELLWHRYFRKLLGKGRVFSTEFIGRILLMKARVDRVEFGYDVDNDVYDHSSAEEDNTQSESGSEPEAEEDDDDEEDDDEQDDDEESNNDDEESNNDDEESTDDDGKQVRAYEVEEELGSNA